MRYRIVATWSIEDLLRKETDKLLNEENKRKKKEFDINNPLNAVKRYRSRKSDSNEDELVSWRLRKGTDFVISLCGSGRIADAIEDDYYSHHCFDSFPRRSFREAMAEWVDDLKQRRFTSATETSKIVNDLSEMDKPDRRRRTAYDYFYQTLPRRLVLGESAVAAKMIKIIYNYYLTESINRGIFNPTEAMKKIKTKNPVTIQMDDTDFIICTF